MSYMYTHSRTGPQSGGMNESFALCHHNYTEFLWCFIFLFERTHIQMQTQHNVVHCLWFGYYVLCGHSIIFAPLLLALWFVLVEKKTALIFTHLANAFLNFTSNVSSTIRLFISNKIMIVRYSTDRFIPCVMFLWCTNTKSNVSMNWNFFPEFWRYFRRRHSRVNCSDQMKKKKNTTTATSIHTENSYFTRQTHSRNERTYGSIRVCVKFSNHYWKKNTHTSTQLSWNWQFLSEIDVVVVVVASALFSLFNWAPFSCLILFAVERTKF